MAVSTIAPRRNPPGRSFVFSVVRHLVVSGLALVLAACASGASPPTPVTSPAAPTASIGSPAPTPVGSPGASPSAAPPGVPSPPIDSPEEAIAAVASLDSNFLGYAPRDPDLIGQSSWVDVTQTASGYELTFFRGAGDCPAGCITRSYIKFRVGRDGRVEKRCEWREGEGQAGTPC